MEYYIALILGFLSLVMQALVVYYGTRLYRVVGKTENWSCAWKFYIIANGVILLRRVVSFLTICCLATISSRFLWYVVTEELLAIGVSILLLLFGRKLTGMFTYLFKSKE